MKCGAATVRAARNGLEMGSRPNVVFLRPHIDPGFRGMARNQQSEVWNFACTTCGYLEWAVYDPAGLAFINEQWVAVPAEPETT